MLSQTKIDEVRELLARGNLSQRQIARLACVSRGIVGAVASGKRQDKPPKVPDPDELQHDLPPERCKGCGAMASMPCRTCRMRRIRERQLRLARARQQDRCVAASNAA